jgi:perosamine synthetase
MIPIFKPTLGDEELKEVKDSFDSHWIGLGPKTKKLEEEFCKYTGARNAISLNSCTGALHLCVNALGIKEGDEVLISGITFAATAHAVLFTRAKPILVDVNEDDMQINIEDLKRKITPKTKAIIVVHYGGLVCDMDEIIEIAKQNNLYVIEDAANACGAEYKGKKIGNLASDFTCYSFEAKKNMTTGDGGMIVTNHEGEILDKIRRLRWVGMDKDTAKRFSGNQDKPWEYDIKDLGFKYNMNDITAGIGLVQLKKLDEMNDARKILVNRYNQAFENESWLRVMKEKPNRKNVYWLYILRIEDGDRDELMRHLYANDVLANTSFKPLHFFSFYKDYYEKQGMIVTCPIAEKEWNKVVVLPLYPTMTEQEQNKVIETVKSFKKKDLNNSADNNDSVINPMINIKIENKAGSSEFEGLKIIHPEVFGDSRGEFFEFYNKKDFEKAGLNVDFVQDNQSLSKKGVLRGLHLQKEPYGQGKLVRVVKGRVLDIVVDLRKNSKTYKKWCVTELTEENKTMMYIPNGFAHGFLSLEDGTIFQYKCTNYYNKEAELGIRWDDPELGIDWQLEKHSLSEEDLIISEKDKNLPLLNEI